MKLQIQSAVIFVKDIQESRRFYEGLLGLPVTMDLGPNVEIGSRFALWQVDHALQTIFGHAPQDGEPLGHRNMELYFETEDIDGAWAQLTDSDMAVKVVHPICEQPWAQRVFRVYDPDGHIVELGEAMPFVVRRLLASGMTHEEAAAKTGFPLDVVNQIAAAPAN